jgi:hypothetical protein
LRLVIAGLNIAVDNPQEDYEVVLQRGSNFYGDFIAAADADPIDIQTNVIVGGAAESSLRLLMGGREGVSWFGRNRARRVAMRTDNHGCLWDCFLKTSAREATVYVPQTLVHHEQGRDVVDCPVTYPLDQLLLMYHMASRQGAIFHTAGAFREGRCALFLGRSRAGKSTVSRQLEARGGFGVVSDDRIIVRKLTEGHTAFGTPWPGEAQIARNESAPLGALFFLHKASGNRVVPLPPQRAFERLLPVTSIPWFDPDVFPRVLAYLEKLTAEVPAFDLHFKPTPEVADDIDRVLRSIRSP